MKDRQASPARFGLYFIAVVWMLVIVPLSAWAAPYAAHVIDARTGEVLHSSNADTRLHPASLTKMMTLYVAFEAIERGEISLDTIVTISANAAAEPPSKLGLRAGQRIALRYLIRAAAIRSANDAATAIGEAVAGSEAAFARRMTRTAQAMGMSRTTFRNMHGLTQEGHLSTARDMTILGRHMFYDYPQYYNLFSRRTADAGVAEVANTNRRFLGDYKGADGIKTGYTRAAGFNLVASAERGNQRVIATVFGGQSTAQRNQKVAELLDLGFNRAPRVASVSKPARPAYQGGGNRSAPEPVVIAAAPDAPVLGAVGKTIRLNTAVKSSLRPMTRPGAEQADPGPQPASRQDDIRQALIEAQGLTQPETVAQAAPTSAPASAAAPVPEKIETVAMVTAAPPPPQTAAPAASITPRVRPLSISRAQEQATNPAPDPAREVVTRVSTSGGKHWGVNVGRFPNQGQAERVLLKTALLEMDSLDGSLRRVVRRQQGFDANFMGMSRDQADLACRRLQARQVTCFMIGPPPG